MKKGNTPQLDADVFFAVLPILIKEWFKPIKSGSYVLPLFRGRCPRALLDASDPYEAITKCEAVPGASCVVRLVDTQPDAFLEQSLYSEPGPPYCMDRVEEVCRALGLEEAAYTFPENDLEARSSKRLKKLAPVRDVEFLEEVLNKVFAEAVGIRHYRLR